MQRIYGTGRPLLSGAVRLLLTLGLIAAGCACLTGDIYGQQGKRPDVESAGVSKENHDHTGKLAPQHDAGHAIVFPSGEPGTLTLGMEKAAIPDLLVLDQHGKRFRFYSDLIKGRVVVLSFFFTRCIDVCPMMGVALSRLYKRLADRVGKDVFFVSVSKDPDTDTPPRLKEWGDAYGVKSGWTLVTGRKADMEKIVSNLARQSLGTSEHGLVLLIGNDENGSWTAESGYARPEALIQQIERVKRSKVQ